MTRTELDILKEKARSRKEKSTDLDVLVFALFSLPHGQLKKLLTEEVLELLKKYGYTE